MSEENRTIDDRSHSHQMLTSIVANTFNYAVSRGLDMEQINAATGLTRTDLINPETRLPEVLAPTIWKLLGEAYPGQVLALHAASAVPLTSMGQLAQAVQYAEDLRSALQEFIKYRAVLSDQLHMELIESDSEAMLQPSHPIDEIDGGYGAEAGLGVVTRLVRETLVAEDPLVRVEFRHQPFGSLETYIDFFKVPVRFQQKDNKLVFRRDALDLPTQKRDTYLLGYIQKNLDLLQDHWRLHSNPSQVSQLYDAIARNAESSEYSAEALAQQLNMSLRALQRQARDRGFTVSQLLENAREAKAKQLLTDPKPTIEAISDQLGYSDDRAFRRAFKRWTGQTPAEFRRKLL
ncbi:MAG: AraC family transcriptional regulator ligand-binding domain-containing protein [Cyanobacteria bacterium J06638_20]